MLVVHCGPEIEPQRGAREGKEVCASTCSGQSASFRMPPPEWSTDIGGRLMRSEDIHFSRYGANEVVPERHLTPALDL